MYSSDSAVRGKYSADASQTTGGYEENPHPLYNPQPKRPPAPWSTSLFDCNEDYRNSCITCFCPCITFGRIAELVDKGTTSCGTGGALYTIVCCVTCCACCYSCFYRQKMRQQLKLEGHPCGDCLIHCFCEPCALCQEYRELRDRGYDMSTGWIGHIEKRKAEMEMAPIIEGGMSRN